MSDLFRKKAFEFTEVSVDDKGVSVEKILELIKYSNFYQQFYDLFKIKEIEKEFISIPGATKLVDTMIQIENSFEKFDLDSSIQNLEFNPSEKFSITFKNITDEEINTIIDSDEFTAQPIYSSQNDFFSSLFNMDRYANKLFSRKLNHLVYKNLKEVKEILKSFLIKDKRYRIVRDKENNYYLRAITSKRYHDYNNNIAVFVGLITLHNEMKKSKSTFIVQRCEFNESYVRVFFKSGEIKMLENIGKLENIIEVSNDEIKREALRFSCAFSINYGSSNEKDKSIYIKPSRTKANILSIRHNILPKTAMDELVALSNYKEIQNDLLKDIEAISKIKSPEAIKHLVFVKIKSAKSTELKKSKNNILSELTNKVNSLIELLEMMNKIEMLAEEIDAKEYLRYLVYEALVYKK
ncbi:hypothetical protein [Flavobacterium sp.]|uniref:hypothetical protein n=1 Tax=Flavobacterium sp. TaxID=239 RepID=UPI002626C5AB|nr:hypothetical protein [Flavobacterium sp.]